MKNAGQLVLISNRRNKNSTMRVSSSRRHDYPRDSCLAHTQNLNRRSKTSMTQKRPTTSMNDHSLIVLREKLFDDPDYPLYDLERDDLIKLQCHLREYAQYSAYKCDYECAQQATDVIEIIRKEQNNRIRSEIMMQPIPMCDLSNFDKSLETKLNEFDQQTQIKQMNIQKLYEQQLQRLNEKWSQSQVLLRYRKASAQLLELKEREKQCAIARDYEGAQMYHDEVDELIRVETERAQNELLVDYQKAKNALLEKQKNEMRIFDETRIDARKSLEATMMKDKEALVNRNNFIQSFNRTGYSSRSLPFASYEYFTGRTSSKRDDMSVKSDQEDESMCLQPENPQDDFYLPDDDEEKQKEVDKQKEIERKEKERKHKEKKEKKKKEKEEKERIEREKEEARIAQEKKEEEEKKKKEEEKPAKSRACNLI